MLNLGTEEHLDSHPWPNGTAVMGIVNVTPDSYYDGRTYETPEAAVRRATEMIDAGADIVDVEGESARLGGIRSPKTR